LFSVDIIIIKKIISLNFLPFMKKISIVLPVLLLVAISTIKAQHYNADSEYKTALGIKFLDGAGISFKHFINEKTAIEGIGFFGGGGARITGLYEIHFDIEGADGLKWYVGPGVHIGFYKNLYGYNRSGFLGVDGVLGLDYKIKSAPLNLSLDWQPSFEFGLNRGFTGSWGGFGIRYTF
jgi:hypothetical protein